MQCYTYYHRYPLDRPFYKILVRTRSHGRRSFLTSASAPSHQVAVLWSVFDSQPVYPRSSSFSPRLLEAAHSVLIGHFFYHYVIINWGDALAIVTQPIVWSVLLGS